MSAFIVEDKTINTVVTKLAHDRDGGWLRRKFEKNGYDLETTEGCTKLGWDMFSLNIRAVNQRYEDNSAETFRPLNYKYSPEYNFQKIHCLKALRCWLYQCSEGDCDEKEVFKLIESVGNSWALDIVRDLPAWDEALAWN